MFGITRKAALVGTTAVLCTALLGGSALAAFAPAPATSFSVDPEAGAITMSEGPKGADALKTVLDTLVSKGVITQAQEDAILAAVKDARGNGGVLRAAVTGLLQESASYLGFNTQELHARLPGTSLGALADKTNGKSRDGLIADLTSFADGRVDKLLADGKITQDQASKAKAAIPERVTKLVDHVWSKTDRHPRANIRSFVGDLTKDAVDYLGISRHDLVTQLRSGTSLGKIADATAGKSRQGLIDTLVSDANTKIDQAVQQGRMTQAQADQLKTKVQGAITKLVDHTGGRTPKAST